MDDMLFIAQKFKRVQGSENRNVTVLKTLFKPTKLLLMILKQLNQQLQHMGQMLKLPQDFIIPYNKRLDAEFLPELSQLFPILRFLKP